MISSTYEPTYRKIRELINSSRLNEAFFLVKNSLNKYEADRIAKERIESLETTYRYLLKFMADGHEDPSREKMINEIKEGLYRENDLLMRQSVLSDSGDMYSTAKRMENLKNATFETRYSELRNALSGEENGANSSTAPLTTEALGAYNNLFDHVWTMQGSSPTNYSALREMLKDQNAPDFVKAGIVSAILLSNSSFFDPDSFQILLDTYDPELSAVVKARIIVAITLITLIYPERIRLNVNLKSQLTLMKEDSEMKNLLNNALKGIVRVYDTQRVTTKMKEEVIPGLLKVNPEIIEKMRNLASVSEDFLSEANPEWEEIIEQSGIQDKLQEINDMQMEGADVMMTTFANLKGYPFFHRISNWFLPFIPNHPEIIISENENGENFRKFTLAMCDSDVYSFILSMKSMPAAQRALVLKNMEQQMEQAEEVLTSAVGDSAETKFMREMRHYLQDLYRFFKLFRRRAEFKDLFSNPLQYDQLKPVVELLGIDSESVKNIGDFYFKHQYFPEAAGMYELMDKFKQADLSLWERIGYCYDKSKQFPRALEWYKKAEIVNPESAWLEKRLAVTLKNCGSYKEALHYYEKVLKREPENYHLLMSTAQCFLENGDYDNALQNFYHAEYLKPEKRGPKRAIAWTTLLSGKTSKAMELYQTMLQSEPGDKTDYLNAALCALSIKDVKLALHYYESFLAQTENRNFRELMTALKEDSGILSRLGIQTQTLRLVIDCLRYQVSPD